MWEPQPDRGTRGPSHSSSGTFPIPGSTSPPSDTKLWMFARPRKSGAEQPLVEPELRA